MKPFILPLFIIIVAACSEIKTTPKNSKFRKEQTRLEQSLIINEYCVKGTDSNELVDQSDWFEIFNPTDEEIVIEKGKWSVTDNFEEPEKFFLPKMTIQPKSYAVIWCDGKNSYEGGVHTNFKLNASGEDIGLYYEGQLIDAVTYGELLTESVSYGRVTDGAEDWMIFQQATIGQRNTTSGQL